MKRVFSIALLATITFDLLAADTFDKVYDILQANCSAKGCHGGSNPESFSLDNSKSSVYNAIFEVVPENKVAADKGDKLIDAGYPNRSFLLRKIANGLSNNLALGSEEGELMPKNNNPLGESDIEIIRQWIIRGAPMTGNVVDEQLIIDYYTNGGAATIAQPPAPDPSEGVQIHLGPVFMPAGDEKEFFNKYDLQFDEDKEITRMEVIMNDESHHFILYKFDNPSVAADYNEGLRDFDAFDFFNNSTEFIMAWQNDDNVVLPKGTAYFWEKGTHLDLNYHLLNSNNATLASSMYINLYFQSSGTAEKEMKSILINNAVLFIPNNNQPLTFSHTQTWNETRSIWNIVSHTHKYGIDYDVWTRNSDGSKGDQVYEGFYNFNYTFNQGYFEWDHPPVRYFEPLLKVENGLIHEATYQNDGDRSVSFGFTTNDEMMIIYVQYVEGEYKIPTSVNNLSSSETTVSIYPNPFKEQTQISYELAQPAQVKLELLDVLGKQVSVIEDAHQAVGKYDYQVSRDNQLHGGIYFIKASINDVSTIKRIVYID